MMDRAECAPEMDIFKLNKKRTVPADIFIQLKIKSWGADTKIGTIDWKVIGVEERRGALGNSLQQ